MKGLNRIFVEKRTGVLNPKHCQRHNGPEGDDGDAGGRRWRNRLFQRLLDRGSFRLRSPRDLLGEEGDEIAPADISSSTSGAIARGWERGESW